MNGGGGGEGRGSSWGLAEHIGLSLALPFAIVTVYSGGVNGISLLLKCFGLSKQEVLAWIPNACYGTWHKYSLYILLWLVQFNKH